MVMYLEIDFKSIEQEMYTLIKIMDAEGNVKNGWQEVARFFFFSLPVLISTSYFQRLNKDRWIICLGQWGPSCILNSYIHQQLKWK